MTCPFCKETIQDGAIKCRHCGSMLNQQNPQQSSSEKTPIAWAFEPLKKYATFKGRARRKEYWYFILLYIVVAFFIGVLCAIADIESTLLIAILNLALCLPSLAVAIRRLHDTNRCGWWCLLPIVNIIFYAQDSKPGMNQYGPNPKYE